MAQGDAAPMSLAAAHNCGGGRGCGMGAAPCQGLQERLSVQILVCRLVYAVANHGACQHDVDDLEFLEFKVAAPGTTFVAVPNCFTFCCCCQEIFPSSKTPAGTQTDQSVGLLWWPSAFTSRRERQITHRMLCAVPDFCIECTGAKWDGVRGV